MSDGIQFSISDPDKALKKIKAFPDAMKLKGARFAMRKAANLVADEARKGAQSIDNKETDSHISENIAVRFSNRTFKNSGNIMFRVGVMGGANLTKKESSLGLPGKGTQHWRINEFGTSKMPARPFMRPALEQNIGKATAEFSANLNRWIGRNIKKLGK